MRFENFDLSGIVNYRLFCFKKKNSKRDIRVEKGETGKVRRACRLGLFALLIAICIPVSLGAGEMGKKRLAVIGVKNEIHRDEWDNQLIGYGISQLLLQRLFDTGHYCAIEQRPEIIKEINRLIDAHWKGPAAIYDHKDAQRIANEIGSEAVAYAKVVNFSKKRSRGFLGPFSASKTTVNVQVEVYLKEMSAPVRVSKGNGEAITKSTGVLFRIRDGKIYFDQTAVGRATDQAITQAVKGLYHYEN